MELRLATEQDVDAVARLHTDSWRRNYRGALSDEFLDGDLLGDRLAAWTERLTADRTDRCTVIAEGDGALAGFAHTMLDEDESWGALLDNLHVVHALKGRGIGTVLMAETARRVLAARPGEGLYLWVLEQNTAAQAFYGARGGTFVERDAFEPRGGFTNGAVRLRCAWPDPAVLLGYLR